MFSSSPPQPQDPACVSLPISDYGVIGNLHTMALVSKLGSIDFLPFYRIDSPTIFAALLDPEHGGRFQIELLQADVKPKQLYLPDTAILLTRYHASEGIAELTDFMPVKAEENHGALVRSLKGIKGVMRFRVSLEPRFDYARAQPAFIRTSAGWQLRSQGADQSSLHLLTTQEMQPESGALVAEFELREGDHLCWVLEAGDTPRRDLAYYTGPAFEQTLRFWKNWAAGCAYTGRWREVVLRSAITLKLLTSHRFGAPVAAATFGLPESIGGERNWDYRYVWIRDAAFTMYAFLQLGFLGEAEHFVQWLEQRCREMQHPGELQLMYAVDGGSRLDEQTLSHLSGYRGSQPVRIGNAASEQFQLDIYGELLDSIYLFNQHGGPITYDFWQHIEHFVNYVCAHWQEPDHGIWEVRGSKQDFLYSKVMAWVAIDRAIRIVTARSFPAPIEKWLQVRDEIFTVIYRDFWSEDKQAFVQYRGATSLDAAALIMPLVRFLSPHEPRWIATLAAIERELVTDSLVYRYLTDRGAPDGLSGQEGTFSICSFWYVENLAKAGDIGKAQVLFEKMLGYANHLGLFSEQIALNGELLGNFPQAFTHLSLISAALELDRALQRDWRYHEPETD